MVIDSSALIAVLLGEPDSKVYSEAIANAPKRLASAFSVLETSIVIESKKGEPGGRELDLLIHKARIEIVSVNEEQFELARQAGCDRVQGHLFGHRMSAAAVRRLLVRRRPS